MTRLAVSIAGGILVGVTALFFLGLIGWIAGTAAGLSLSFHAGISPQWVVVVLAVLVGSATVASWSAARFHGARSWSAPVGASLGLAGIETLPFLRRPMPSSVWMAMAVAFVISIVPALVVASTTGGGRGRDEE